MAAEQLIFNLVLYSHITAGTLSLVIGPIAMYASKKPGLHTVIGKSYFYVIVFVCLSAILLSVLHWDKSWWFTLVAIFSFSFAWRGYSAVKKRSDNWIKRHISGMLGSYIAMSTALLVVKASDLRQVVDVPEFIFWLLPTIIGTPFIYKTVNRYRSSGYKNRQALVDQ